MKITIESTSVFTILDGREVRVWKGTTAKGNACIVFVAAVGGEEGKDEELARELRASHAPVESLVPLHWIAPSEAAPPVAGEEYEK